MKTIKLSLRSSIETEVKRLVANAPARATFAGITLRARYATTRPQDIVEYWRRIADERSARTWAKILREGRVSGQHSTDVPWNWCHKCETTVDGDMTGEWHDGSEGTCFGCRTVYHAVWFGEDSWSLFEYVGDEEEDEDEGEE
jgi:hypothetical protein